MTSSSNRERESYGSVDHRLKAGRLDSVIFDNNKILREIEIKAYQTGQLTAEDTDTLVAIVQNAKSWGHVYTSKRANKEAKRQIKRVEALKKRCRPVIKTSDEYTTAQALQDAKSKGILTFEEIIMLMRSGQFTKERLLEQLPQIKDKISAEHYVKWMHFAHSLSGDLDKDIETMVESGVYFVGGKKERPMESMIEAYDRDRNGMPLPDVVDYMRGKAREFVKLGLKDIEAEQLMPSKDDLQLRPVSDYTDGPLQWNIGSAIAADGGNYQLNHSLLFKNCRHMAPEVWDMFSPRVYKGVDAWEDYRHFAAYATSAAYYMHGNPESWTDPQNGWGSPSGMLERSLIGSICAEHDTPYFFVNPDLLQAAMMTDPPSEVDWGKMKLPHEGAVFIMPKRMFKSSQGGFINFIAYGRARADKMYKIPHYEERFNVPRDLFAITGMDADAAFDYTKILIDPYRADGEYERPRKMRYEGEIFDNPTSGKVSGADILGVKSEAGTKLSETRYKHDDINTAELIVKVLMNLLLLMEIQPDIIEKPNQSEHRKIGYHKKSRSELWTPNVLGRRYRIIRPDLDPEKRGSHASPRWHWRRGHWREQGKGQLICVDCGCLKAAHDKDTRRCRYNKCLDTCQGTGYRHETHYRKWIEPALINYVEEIAA